LWSTRSSLPPLALNRLSSDGSIVDFYKDGSPVGAIGVVSGNNLKIHSTSSGHSGLSFGTGIVYATDNAGDATNGATSLGSSSYKWKDLHLSGNANLGGSLKAQSVYSEQTASGYTSGQTISITVSSTSEAKVYQIFATRHTGTANKTFEMGYVFYSGNGSGSFSQVKDGSGISISVSGSTISATNTTGTATIYLTVLRLR